jgi:hypothetical protein
MDESVVRHESSRASPRRHRSALTAHTGRRPGGVRWDWHTPLPGTHFAGLLSRHNVAARTARSTPDLQQTRALLRPALCRQVPR